MGQTFLFGDQLDIQPILQRVVAIVGYGAQGRSHALNLRDSGVNVVVGQRPGASFDRAVDDGFQPVSLAEAVDGADVIGLMLPDEQHGSVFEAVIKDHLKAGNIILTCHGFSLHYGLIKPPAGVTAVMVAPKAAGHRVRSAFTEQQGVPCLVAAEADAPSKSIEVARAYAKAIGGGRGGVLHTTFGEETEADLFGEQAVLCGGVSGLVKAGYETLVEAGFQPEVAYFECVHELKLVVDLLYQGGLAHMRRHISNTAEYGDYTRGPRVIGDASRQAMKEILSEVQSGQFAEEWMRETAAGWPHFKAMRRSESSIPMEEVGQRISRLAADPDAR